MNSQSARQKWYYSNWVIILFLIFFFPVGVVLVWKSAWTLKSKLIASVYAVLIITLFTIAVINASPTIEANNMSPTKMLTVQDSAYRLEGKIYPYKAELTVNGEKLATDDKGKYATTVQLKEGENAIHLTAKDGKKITEKVYTVKRLSAAEIAETKRVAQEKADKATDAKKKSDTDAKAKADAVAKAAQQKAKDAADAKTKADAVAKAEAAASAAKQKAAVVPKPQPTKSTMDLLWEASDSVVKTRKGVDIHFDPGIGTAQLFVTDGSEWNEKFLVQRTYNRFVLWGQKVNGLTGVQTIDVQTKTEFVDGYGNNSMQTAVRAMMDSDKFRKYNWNNLQAMPIHNQIQTDGTLYLQSSIKSKVNLDDAKLFL